MDVAGIRADLAGAARSIGYNGFGSVVADVNQFPAMVAGLPSDIVRLTSGAAGKAKWRLTLPVTLLYSLADERDAQGRLDAALSSGCTGSVYDALNASTLATTLGHAPTWQSVAWVRGNNARSVTVGETKALAFDIELEIIA